MVEVIHDPLASGKSESNGQDTAESRATKPSNLVLSRKVDEARYLGGGVFHPHSLRLLGRGKDFQMRLRSTDASGLTVGLLEYATPVHISSQAFSSAYQVNFPTLGQLKMTYGDQKLLTSPRTAAVHGPNVATSLEGWGEPTMMLGLKIPEDVIKLELETLLGRTPEKPLAFGGHLDLSSRNGRDWFDAVALLAHGLRKEESLMDNPLISHPAAQAVVRGLLLVAPNNYSPELTGDITAAGPAYVRRAVAYIEEHANQPLTLNKIAEAVHIGPRALQTGFQEHLASTPMSMVRKIRLRKAHEALQAASPGEHVSAIAREWGFMHAGRFAIHYAQTYGRSPSETLAK